MNKKTSIRINKFLSEKGSYSRRGIDKLIQERRITVNGKVIKLGTKVNYDDEIRIDGELIHNPKKKKMYVTLSPCPDCARAIVNSNIESVFYDDEYRNVEGLEILRSAGLNVQTVKKKTNMACVTFDRPNLW